MIDEWFIGIDPINDMPTIENYQDMHIMQDGTYECYHLI